MIRAAAKFIASTRRDMLRPSQGEPAGRATAIAVPAAQEKAVTIHSSSSSRGWVSAPTTSMPPSGSGVCLGQDRVNLVRCAQRAVGRPPEGVPAGRPGR